MWRMTETSKAGLLILKLLAQVGKPYLYDVVVKLTDPDPPEFSCSQLVKWGLFQVGVTKVKDCIIAAFDGAAHQYFCCKPISPATAKHLPGALVFVQNKSAYPGKPSGIGHVGVSLGNGYVLEARGKKWGVVISPWRDSFNLAGKVTELYI
jgi:cell wall-associated NlpC family hydrolase